MEDHNFEYYFERENGDEEKLIVSFEYQPEEKMVKYYSDGSGYPGCPAEINVYFVGWRGRNIINWLDKQIMEDINDKAWDLIASLEPYEPDEDIIRGR